MAAPRDVETPPPVGDPRRADPAWWTALWHRLAPEIARVALTARTWEDGVRAASPGVPPADLRHWQGWLMDPETGPSGPAATGEGLIQGVLALGTHIAHADGHDSGTAQQALRQWLRWHGQPQGLKNVPSPSSAGAPYAVGWGWQDLTPRDRTHLLAVLDRLNASPGVRQGLTSAIITHVPSETLGLTETVWQMLSERLYDRPEGWRVRELEAQGVPPRWTGWMRLNPLGQTQGEVNLHGIHIVREGLEARPDWPTSVLAQYATSDPNGLRLFTRIRRLNEQTQAPLPLLRAEPPERPSMQSIPLQIAVEMLRLAHQPQRGRDAPQLHPEALPEIGRWLAVGWDAEAAWQQDAAAAGPADRDAGLPRIVKAWRDQVRTILAQPLVVPIIDRPLQRRGLLSHDAEVRRLMLTVLSAQRGSASAQDHASPEAEPPTGSIEAGRRPQR